jgi:hypothetical protein
MVVTLEDVTPCQSQSVIGSHAIVSGYIGCLFYRIVYRIATRSGGSREGAQSPPHHFARNLPSNFNKTQDFRPEIHELNCVFRGWG